MTRLAYLDCIGGVAGDMLLAALLDAGAPSERLTELPAALGLADVRLEVTRVSRGGIAALHVDVVEPEGGLPRSAPELRAAIERSSIRARPKERALAALDRLIAVEARVHGVIPEDVRLHELGSADTLVDLCGGFVLLEALGIERVVCSPLPYARGLVDVEHGILPSPTPAVLALLEGADLVGVQTAGELVTPTGAAIVAEACAAWGPLPPMTLEHVGHGAGTRDLPDRPNVLRVVVGEAAEAVPAADVVLLEAGLDDLVPELVPDAVGRCFEAGAVDVWTTPIHMKKGRPGVVVSALARPDSERAVARALLEHSSTLGVRVADLRRYELERERREVDVDGHAVGVKLGVLDGRVVNVAPEHDDCARVALATGRPVKQVWAAALAAGQELYGRAR
ncbi:MAG TPA: nickel pincer cofactor biosynthesis protein LarC [Actinomycetota bacterium]|nr:nickel pincer cofactor biosynthesis protein LarC [Actinomycetota bacterium]